MGLFDQFKKKAKAEEPTERLENYPELLHVKLLFFDKPDLDSDKILSALKLYFRNVDTSTNDDARLYFFPDIKVELKDAIIAAQCSIFVPADTNTKPEIGQEAFQQNWHWTEANQTVEKCRYEILVTDFMTRTLDYKTRLELFINFLVAVTKATNPQVVYSVNSQKLIDPLSLIKSWDIQEKEILFGMMNVRLFNISNSDRKEVLMDTVGLSQLGLPDFQIRFSDLNESEVARLLWNYAYYIFEKADVIESGNTLLGLEPNSKWRCERQISLAMPERVVINVERS
jgi:hypothetical protein